LHWSGPDIADQLEDLVLICGAPIAMAAAWFREAAIIGAASGLTFHDACWVAAAQAMRVSLVSADTQVIQAGLAESPRTVARRLGLIPSPRPA
ncbi:MAG: hypothetical protein ACYCV5_12370, partial [Acidimicrobiales bacterium]